MNRVFLKKAIHIFFLIAWVIIIGTILYNYYIVISDTMNSNFIQQMNRQAILGGMIDETSINTLHLMRDDFAKNFDTIQRLNLLSILFIFMQVTSWLYFEKKNRYTEPLPRNVAYDNVTISLFSIQGRMSRLDYLKVSLSICFFEIISLVYFSPTTQNELLWFLFTIVFFGLFLLPMTIRRLHDSNRSGWWILISVCGTLLSICANSMRDAFALFFPTAPSPSLYYTMTFISCAFSIYSLYLLYRQGDTCANNYGTSNPLKTYGNKTIYVICICLFILTVASGMLSGRIRI